MNAYIMKKHKIRVLADMSFEKGQATKSNGKGISSEVEEHRLFQSEEYVPKIKIIGVGHAGNKLTGRLLDYGIPESLLVNVYLNGVSYISSRIKGSITICNHSMRGLSWCGNPAVPRECAIESEDNLKNGISDCNTILIMAGLGHSIGTGVSPEIARIFKEMNPSNRVISFVTLPFGAEGQAFMNYAIEGFEDIKKYSDFIIVIPNNRVLKLYRRYPLDQIFQVCDNIDAIAVAALYDSIKQNSDILNFIDSIKSNKKVGISMLAFGDSDESTEDALDKAFKNPLNGIDLREAIGLIALLYYRDNIEEGEIKSTLHKITKKLDQSAFLSFNSIRDEKIENKIRVVLLPIAICDGQTFDRKRLEKEITWDISQSV
jgi:Cell division GTPase